MRKPLIMALGALTLMVSGCATTDTPPDSDSDTSKKENRDSPATASEPSATVREATAHIEYRDFPSDVLFALLSAEVAAQRGRFDVTLSNYVQAARDTRDPGIIERAVVIARALGAENALQQLAPLWLEVNPDDPNALRLAAMQALDEGDFETALTHMENLHEQGAQADFEKLAGYAGSLDPERQSELLSLYHELYDRHPESPDVGYSLALIKHSLKQHQAALEILNPVLSQSPDYQPAITLKGKLLFDTGQQEEALNYLRTQSSRYPDNRRLGILYARMLVDSGDLQAAEDAFESLVERFPDASGLRLSRALVALENGNDRIAEEELRKLIAQGQQRNQAHYYLGRLLESQDKPLEALAQFEQVDGGQRFFPALSRASLIEAREGALFPVQEKLERLRLEMPQQAEQLWLVEIDLLLELEEPQLALTASNQALEEFPDNHNMRYTRAMLHEQLGNLTPMEQDLRQILQEDPDNATALNALGYTLTLHTNRYEEARELIARAIELEPDNPAIMDSMGWVLYHQGDMEAALEWLNKAYETMPDPEIAAHLGEVLWQLDRRDEAKMIWRRALTESKKEDDVSPVLEYIKRYDLNPEEL
ncbi:MAG: tetratricopeptide repeat protein [Oleiphilaceae bacterium]|nr:tetratricopeptide repeat protein [Oleiphilaceae bacterium]